MKITLSIIYLSLCSVVMAADDSSKHIKAQGGTGFTINNIRTFEVDENTIYKEDGEIIPEIRAQGGTGYKIRYRASEVNPNITQGLMNEVELISIYKGPVTATDSLQVFDIDALLSDNTYIAGAKTLDQLTLGDQVIVSGFIDSNSVAMVTRVELVDSLKAWKISGYVNALSANQLFINNQAVNFDPSDVYNCQPGLSLGDFIEVDASADINYTSGLPINTVTSINCVDQSIIPDTNNDNVIIEGMVDSVSMTGDFVLTGQQVLVTPTTRYIRGRAEDLQMNIKVEVEGTVDTLTGDMEAVKVRFLEPRINIIAPVLPENLSENQFQVAGQTFLVSPQTLDPDGILNAGGLNEAKQLQFRGYQSGGVVNITRINQRGQADYNDVKLTGLVTAIDDPMFDLFGVTIDTLGSVFFNEQGQPITVTDFFSTIIQGTDIMIESATLDAGTGIISGGFITIEQIEDDLMRNNKLPNSNVIGVGTITSLPDIIFQSSFEVD